MRVSTLPLLALTLTLTLTLALLPTPTLSTPPTLVFPTQISETTIVVTQEADFTLRASLSSSCAPLCVFNITCSSSSPPFSSRSFTATTSSNIYTLSNASLPLPTLYSCSAYASLNPAAAPDGPSNSLDVDVRIKPTGSLSLSSSAAFVGERIGATVAFLGGGSFSPGNYDVYKASPPYPDALAGFTFIGTPGPSSTSPLYIPPLFLAPFEPSDLTSPSSPTDLKMELLITNTESGSARVPANSLLRLYPRPTYTLTRQSLPLITVGASPSLRIDALDAPGSPWLQITVSIVGSGTLASLSQNVTVSPSPSPSPSPLFFEFPPHTLTGPPVVGQTYTFSVVMATVGNAVTSPDTSAASFEYTPVANVVSMTPLATTVHIPTEFTLLFSSPGSIAPFNLTLHAPPHPVQTFDAVTPSGPSSSFAFTLNLTLDSQLASPLSVSVSGVDALGVPLNPLPPTSLVINSPLSAISTQWSSHLGTVGHPIPFHIEFEGGTSPYTVDLDVAGLGSVSKLGIPLSSSGHGVVTLSESDRVLLSSSAVVFSGTLRDAVGASLSLPLNGSSTLAVAPKPSPGLVTLSNSSLTTGSNLTLSFSSPSGGSGPSTDYTLALSIAAPPGPSYVGPTSVSFPGTPSSVTLPSLSLAPGSPPLSVTLTLTLLDALGAPSDPLLFSLDLFPPVLGGSLAVVQSTTTASAPGFGVNVSGVTGGQPPYVARIGFAPQSSPSSVVWATPLPVPLSQLSTVAVPDPSELPSLPGTYVVVADVGDVSLTFADAHVVSGTAITIMPLPQVTRAPPALPLPSLTTAGMNISLPLNLTGGVGPFASMEVVVVDADTNTTLVSVPVTDPEGSAPEFELPTRGVNVPSGAPFVNARVDVVVTDAVGVTTTSSLDLGVPFLSVYPPFVFSGPFATPGGVRASDGLSLGSPIVTTASLPIALQVSGTGGRGPFDVAVASVADAGVTFPTPTSVHTSSPFSLTGPGTARVRVQVTDASGFVVTTGVDVVVNPRPSGDGAVTFGSELAAGSSISVSVTGVSGGTGMRTWRADVVDPDSGAVVTGSAASGPVSSGDGSGSGSGSLVIDREGTYAVVVSVVDSLGVEGTVGNSGPFTLTERAPELSAAFPSPPKDDEFPLWLLGLIIGGSVALCCAILLCIFLVCRYKRGASPKDGGYAPSPIKAPAEEAGGGGDYLGDMAFEFDESVPAGPTAGGLPLDDLEGGVPVPSSTVHGGHRRMSIAGMVGPKPTTHVVSMGSPLPSKPPPPIGFVAAGGDGDTPRTPGRLPSKPPLDLSPAELLDLQ